MIRGMTAPSFMDLALKTAENAGKAGEVPIGCVIVRGFDVIATAGNDGSYTLTVSFAVGTNPDINTVNVQNRVSLALPQLP